MYYAHPYASHEKYNRILRRVFPKGKKIDSYTFEHISNIEVWCNSLPGIILGHKTLDEIFEVDLENIYKITSA